MAAQKAACRAPSLCSDPIVTEFGGILEPRRSTGCPGPYRVGRGAVAWPDGPPQGAAEKGGECRDQSDGQDECRQQDAEGCREADLLGRGSGLTARLPNEPARTSPAVAMAGAVCRTARATAERAGPGRSISSLMRSLMRML